MFHYWIPRYAINKKINKCYASNSKFGTKANKNRGLNLAVDLLSHGAMFLGDVLL